MCQLKPSRLPCFPLNRAKLSRPGDRLLTYPNSVSLGSDAAVLRFQVLDTEGVEQISFAELCQELRKLVRDRLHTEQHALETWPATGTVSSTAGNNFQQHPGPAWGKSANDRKLEPYPRQQYPLPLSHDTARASICLALFWSRFDSSFRIHTSLS